MDLHVHTREGTTHVCTIHRGSKDETPLQLISAQELARLQQAERELIALRQSRGAPAS